MNFIIEVIKCHPESEDLIYVVRRQDGFPMFVADSLDDLKDLIQKQIDQALKPKSDS